jgi:5-methylthioadenosine/S-adenosylhomocysteine deaminase
MEREIGSVEVGKRADIILLDANLPNMSPIYGPETVVSDLVYSASSGNVSTTIVDGKVLMENRQLKTVDLDKTLASAQEIANKLSRG